MRVLLASLVLALVACGSGQKQGPSDGTVTMATLTADQINKAAAELTELRGFPEAERKAILSRLQAYLADEAPLLKAPGIQGVGAYDAASGGFLIKGTLGKGQVKIGPKAAPRPFEASGVTVGAVVGGKASRGVFLILGLQAESNLATNYGFTSAGATVGSGNDRVRIGDAEARKGGHKLRFFSLGTGVSADAGRGDFELSFKN